MTMLKRLAVLGLVLMPLAASAQMPPMPREYVTFAIAPASGSLPRRPL